MMPSITDIHRYCRLLPTLAVLFFLVACSESDEITPVEPQVLEEVVSTKTVTLQELVDFLYKDYDLTEEQRAEIDENLAPLRLVACNLIAHAVRYHSTAPDGSPVTASGVVYFPTRTPRGVLEIMPINKSKGNCVSRNPLTVEAVAACLGYICIIPDLIGCGASETLPISYMQHENSAVVAADLRRAAAELIRNTYRQQLPSSTFIGGYSLGGSIAWALARHYALHPELGVNVEEVWCGGGAYDPSVAFEAFKTTLFSQYPLLPNIIYSMNYYDHLELDFTKVFCGDLLEHYQEWCTGDVPIGELASLLGFDLQAYLQMDFFSPDNPDYRRLMEVLKSKAIPNDWKPQARVHLVHSREDTYVPRACSDLLYAYLQSVGADVEYTLMEENHVMGGLLWGQAVIQELSRKMLFP